MKELKSQIQKDVKKGKCYIFPKSRQVLGYKFAEKSVRICLKSGREARSESGMFSSEKGKGLWTGRLKSSGWMH